MKLHEIRTFVLAAKLQSFSKVADVLFTTQPSVSKHISSLEDELGQPLFKREPHMLELTDFGQQFLPYAEAIIQAEVNAQTFLMAQSKKPDVFLALDVSETTGSVPEGSLPLCLSHGLREFQKLHGDVYVSVRFTPDRDLADMVKSQRTDLALCSLAKFGDNAAAANGVKKLFLAKNQNYLAYCPVLGTPGSLGELLEKVASIAYMHDRVSLDMLSLLYVEKELPPKPVSCLNWYSVLTNAVQNSAAGLIPAAMLPLAQRSGLSVFPLDEAQFTTDLCLLMADNPERLPYARALGTCIQRAMEEYRGVSL